jgi:vacuolar-type H+-ATPase subunit E/Vma4
MGWTTEETVGQVIERLDSDSLIQCLLVAVLDELRSLPAKLAKSISHAQVQLEREKRKTALAERRVARDIEKAKADAAAKLLEANRTTVEQVITMTAEEIEAAINNRRVRQKF